MTAAKVTCEDVRIELNGTVTGSTYYLWQQSIESGSLGSIITGSDVYLRGLMGNSIWDSSDTDVVNTVFRCELAYVCFRTLVLNSGGVIVDGLSWSVGPFRVDGSVMLSSYINLINMFKDSAFNYIRSLQPMALLVDAEMYNIPKTAYSVW